VDKKKKKKKRKEKQQQVLYHEIDENPNLVNPLQNNQNDIKEMINNASYIIVGSVFIFPKT
jgi:glucosamine 6-phosphate synthetase-like amidotransferase/phosphosugar isomerase protein